MASRTNTDYGVAIGFQEDCAELVEKFEKVDSVRFQDFSSIWLDMKFSLVFVGRNSYAELLQFCEDALRIAKLFILPPYRIKTRIGGLYLLYGIYYKKPIDSVKIKIVLQEWKSILELQEYVRKEKHTDANYVLTKLIMDDAFCHCALDREYGLEMCFRTKENKRSNRYTVLPGINDAIDKDLPEIDTLSKEYHKAKCAISKGDQAKRGLDMFDPSFCEKWITQGVMQNVRGHFAGRSGKSVLNPRDSKGTAVVKKGANYNVRTKQGHGFDSDSSEDELPLTTWHSEGFDPNLPDTFDDHSSSSDFNS